MKLKLNIQKASFVMLYVLGLIHTDITSKSASPKAPPISSKPTTKKGSPPNTPATKTDPNAPDITLEKLKADLQAAQISPDDIAAAVAANAMIQGGPNSTMGVGALLSQMPSIAPAEMAIESELSIYTMSTIDIAAATTAATTPDPSTIPAPTPPIMQPIPNASPVPLNLPLLGLVHMLRAQDTQGDLGYKIGSPLTRTFGDITFSNLLVTFFQGRLYITGDVTLFGKKAKLTTQKIIFGGELGALLTMQDAATVIDQKEQALIEKILLGTRGISVAQNAPTGPLIAGITFDITLDPSETAPTVELIPGKQTKLDKITVILDNTMPPRSALNIIASAELFGTTTHIMFERVSEPVLSPDGTMPISGPNLALISLTNAYAQIPAAPLKNIIPKVAGTPLDQAKVIQTTVKISNVTDLKGYPPRELFLQGSIDLSATELAQQPGAQSSDGSSANGTFQCVMGMSPNTVNFSQEPTQATSGVKTTPRILAKITANMLTFKPFGTLANAVIAMSSLTQNILLKGTLQFSLPGGTPIQVATTGSISAAQSAQDMLTTPQTHAGSKYIIFLQGEMQSNITYKGIALQHGRVMYDSSVPALTISASTKQAGFTLNTQVVIRKDPAQPTATKVDILAGMNDLKLEIIPGKPITITNITVQRTSGISTSLVGMSNIYGHPVGVSILDHKAQAIPTALPTPTATEESAPAPSTASNVPTSTQGTPQGETQGTHTIPAYTDIALETANILLKNFIPEIENSPLSNAQITNAYIKVINARDVPNAPQRMTIIQGNLTFASQQAPQNSDGTDQSTEISGAKNLSFRMIMLKVPTKGNRKKSVFVSYAEIQAQEFHIPHFGTISNAIFVIDPINKTINIQGISTIQIPKIGSISASIQGSFIRGQVNPEGKKGKNRLMISGEITSDVSYVGISLKNFMLNFDSGSKTTELAGTASIEGFDFQIILSIAPIPLGAEEMQGDIISTEDGPKRIELRGVAQKQATFFPFKDTKIPMLESIGITNLTPEFVLIKVKGGGASGYGLTLRGIIHFLGEDVAAILKRIPPDRGAPGWFLTMVLTKGATLAQKIPVLGGININEAYITISSANFTDDSVDITSPYHYIRKGINLMARVPLTGPLAPAAKFTGGNANSTFELATTIDLQHPENTMLRVILSNGSPDSHKIVSLGAVSALIGSEGGIPTLGFEVAIIFRPPHQQPLNLVGSMKFEGPKSIIEAFLVGDWVNPFGLNGITISNFGMRVGSIGPNPTEIGGGGKLKMKLGNKTIESECYFVFDESLTDLAFEAKLNEQLTMIDIISGFAEPLHITFVNQALDAFKYVTPKLTNIELRFAPKTVIIGPVTIGQGITIKGDVEMLGEKGSIDLNLDTGGITAIGFINPIHLGPISVTGDVVNPKCSSKCPGFDIQLTLERQNFLISGVVDLGGIYQAKTDIRIGSSGLSFDMEEEFNLGPLGQSKTQIRAETSGPISNPDFKIHMEFSSDIKKKLKEQIDMGIAIAAKEVQKGIDDAERNLNAGAADAQKQINTAMNNATQQINDARKKLDPIKNAKASASNAIKDAQNKVKEINTALHALDCPGALD